MSRRQFQLPSFDVAFLDASDINWETIVEGGANWLLLFKRPVPIGYKSGETTIAIRIPPDYPDAQLDMAYFCPPLQRADGRNPNAVSDLTIDAKHFQQWSRHRTANSPWRPGEDDVSTHLAFVETWLEGELRR